MKVRYRMEISGVFETTDSFAGDEQIRNVEEYGKRSSSRFKVLITEGTLEPRLLIGSKVKLTEIILVPE